MTKKCECCSRTKQRSKNEYNTLVNRLNRIEGQIRGIRGMLEKDAYCADILVQSAAVCAAINAFNGELLAQHVKTCVTEDLKNDRLEAADELIEIFKKLMK